MKWPTASRDDQSELARRLASSPGRQAAKPPAEPAAERHVAPIAWPSATRDEPVEQPAPAAEPVEWPVATAAEETVASREDLAEVAARFGVDTEELAAAAAQFLVGLDETAEPVDRLGAITQIRAELSGATNLDPDLADAAAAVAERSVSAEGAGRHTWYEEIEGQPGMAAGVAEFEETMAAPPAWIHPEAEAEQELVAPATETTTEAVAHTDEWLQPYRRADLDPLPAGASLTDPAIRSDLIAAVQRLAEIEGPVHISIALQRMREEWGLARITRPARAAIEAAIEEAGVAWDGAFIGDPDQTIPPVRHRADGVARKADQVSDTELAIALENLVIDGGVLPVDDLLAAVTRLYGWSPRRSTELDARLTGLLADLAAEGHLLQQPNGLAAAHGLPDAIQLPRHESARRHARHPSHR